MKVHIPNSAFLHNINAFFSTLNTGDPDHLEITSNPRWISVHPLVLSIIGALGKSLEPQKISCKPILAPSGHYLKRMGLFELIGIKPEVKEITESESAGRFIPLTQVKNSDDMDYFLKELVPLLHIQGKPKRVRAIQHIFSELIRNVLEHSESRHGAIVCAQYFKSSNRIAIGVADSGIGLKSSLKKSYPVPNDLEAIKLALTPGVTGTTRKPGGTEQNAGFGLFLIKSIAYAGSDFFAIISGEQMYKLLQRKDTIVRLNGDPFLDRHRITPIPTWNGVAVGVDISLDQTEEFTSLLDRIHEFYSKEVKNRSKNNRHKRPKFI
ncbi:MAG: ATP-binding protein [bacterium]|nr:ATP-binding protein [bacterium]MDZ4285847.1 ATP-binding protein [Candidatus Sungbacteria bacterium]